MTTEERLRKAVKDSEVLKIVYNGGSQPGTMREIAPISIKNGKIWAHCFMSNAVKLFIIEKITVLQKETDTIEFKWNPPDVKLVTHYESIRDILEKKKDTLTDFGWHVESNDICISLHRRFKNGKPIKGSDVSLHYEEFICGLAFGLDGELHEGNMQKRKRPWSVAGKTKDTRSYGTLDKATVVFLEWAELLAPSKP